MIIKRKMIANKDPITISNRALERIKHLISIRQKPTLGVRILIQTKGCSGLKYKIEYADHVEKYDVIVNKEGTKIVIDGKAMLYIIGINMYFEEDELKSGFVFTNPNEKGKCGCGESFHV